MLTEQHTKGDLKAFNNFFFLRKHKFRNATDNSRSISEQFMEMPWKNLCKRNQRGIMAGDKQVKRGKGVVKEVFGCIFLECKYMMRPEAC